MSLKLFMKDNQETNENFKYPASSTLKDEKGEPLEWEFRVITTETNEEITAASLLRVPVAGKKNQYTTDVDVVKLKEDTLVAATVYPNLKDAALQDSYGVKNPEELIKKMINKSGDYNKLYEVLAEKSGITPLEDKVEEAKN